MDRGENHTRGDSGELESARPRSPAGAAGRLGAERALMARSADKAVACRACGGACAFAAAVLRSCEEAPLFERAPPPGLQGRPRVLRAHLVDVGLLARRVVPGGCLTIVASFLARDTLECRGHSELAVHLLSQVNQLVRSVSAIW